MSNFGNSNMGLFSGGTSGGGGGGVSGSGTPNLLPKWSTGTSLTDSQVFDDGTSVGVGTTSPTSGFLFDVTTSAIVRTYLQVGSFTKGAGQTGSIITDGLIQSATGINLSGVTGSTLTQNGFYPSGNTIQLWAGNNQIGSFGLQVSTEQYFLINATFSPSVAGNAGSLNGIRVKSNVSKALNVSNTTAQTQIIIDPTINQVNGTGTASGTLRGIYYNPTITALGGSTHNAWENTSGNIVFGNFSGSALSGRVLQMDNNGKVSAQDGSFTLYFGTSNDIVNATSGVNYLYGNLTNGNDLVFDLVNNEIFFRNGGNKNGLSIGINTNVVQSGVLNNASSNTPTYLEFDGANNKFYAWDSGNGVQNGLEVDFATLQFSFGNYRISDGGIYIDATNHTFVLNQSNYQTSGYTEIQAYELKLSGSNLETATPPASGTLTYLKVTINGTAYLITAEQP